MACTSCGSECSGTSCSMCYGDPGHGDDGYYDEFLKRQWEQEMESKWEEAQHEYEDLDQDESTT